jgi:hypothetical protein
LLLQFSLSGFSLLLDYYLAVQLTDIPFKEAKIF